MVPAQEDVPGKELKPYSVPMSPLVYVPHTALGGQANAVVNENGPAQALVPLPPQSART